MVGVAAIEKAIGVVLCVLTWAFPRLWRGRAFRYNLLFVPHKRISTSIPNAKFAA